MSFQPVMKKENKMIRILNRSLLQHYVIGIIKRVGNILRVFVSVTTASPKLISPDKTLLVYPTGGFSRTRLKGGQFPTWGDTQKITVDLGK